MFKLVKKLLVIGLLVGSVAGCTNKSNQGGTAKDEVVLYVVRHGKTMLNTTDRVQGWSDAVLTKPGVEVVEALGKGIKDVKFDTAYSSDSGRAIQTAEIVLDKSDQSKLKLEKDWRLREFNFGTYEGDLNHTMWSDIAKSEGKSLEEWMKSMNVKGFADSVAALDKERIAELINNGKAKEGVNWPAETYEEIQTRLKASVSDIVDQQLKNGGGNVLIVSHGLSIMALIDSLDPSFEIPAGGLKNASVTKIIYKDGEYKVEVANDLSYVEAGLSAAE